MSENVPAHACIPGDLREYLDVCATGTYYRVLAEMLGMPYVSVAERKRVKKLSCRVLFGWPRPGDPRWQAFVGRWPSVQAFLDYLKAGDCKHAAHVLQRAEARVMIQGAADRLRRSHPDLPLLTVHDSVVGPVGSEDLAREAIQRVWSR